ncbi:MAG: hypothetical protein WBE13_06440 [Candidatus Acidiferrum sp.]
MQDLRSLIESINSEEEKRLLENFRFMEEQKIKKTLGPALWEDLKQTLREFCSGTGKVSPSKLQLHTESLYEISLVNQENNKKASLTYNTDVNCVFYETPVGKGRMVLRPSADGNSVQFMVNDIPRTLEEIAFILISQIKT